MNRLLSFRQFAFPVTALSILGLCLSASAVSPVPFRGRADLAITGFQDFPPATRVLTASAIGQATHLGRFTRTETITANLSTGAFTGTLVFIAANGDQLNANVIGQFSPTFDSAEGTYVFTGAPDGRFRNASGQAAFKVTSDGTGFHVTFNGTVQY